MGLDIDGNIEVAVLDDGVGIPTRMRQRYAKEKDEELLEMAFDEGISTRRKRPGGFGLANIRGGLAFQKGRLVIVSGGAQANLKFDTGQYKVSALTYRILGTWCSATFFRERGL